MKILIATDGSENANAAVDLLAAGLQAHPDDHHFVLTVVPEAPLMGTELQAPAGGPTQSLTETAEAIVQNAVMRLQQAGHNAAGAVRLGNPVDEILDSVEEERADLVVLGAIGIGRVRRFLVGSVAERVARTATCSVLAVRQPANLANALLATDGSTAVARATDVYLALAADQIGEVTALEVNPAEGSRATADAALRLAAAGATVQQAHDSGNEVEAILRQARESQAGIIVLGAKKHIVDDRPYLGSTAHGVLLNAPCSVLIGR